MKRFFKLLCLLVMVAAISVAAALPAAARVDSEVYFHGLEQGFVFMSGMYTDVQQYTDDLFPMFKNVMPGDVFTQYIEIRNRSDDFGYIDVYLRAIPHDDTDNPLSPEVAERETVESMLDFLSQLQLKVWNEETGELIYEASPDKTAQLTDNVFLVKLRFNHNAYLRLELTVPHEMGSKYAYRTGEVDWAFHAECFKEGGGGGGGDIVVPSNNLTVTKVWDDGDVVRPVSVTVKLLCDGKTVDSQTLNGLNQWTYTWSDLDKGHKWTVREVVPAGYTAKYDNYGSGLVVITNTKPIPPETPDKPVIPGNPIGTDQPGGGGNPGQPDVVVTTDVPAVTDNPEVTDEPPVTAVPGETDVPDTTVPGTTDMPGAVDTTDEPDVTDVPEVPVIPVLPVGPDGKASVTVVKKWAGDEDSADNRPVAVTAALFNGSELLEAVMLGEHNGWTYTWDGLDPDGQWRVIEAEIPAGYAPSYEVNENGTVIITNTATLIKTGQTKWHIPVLAGVGLVLVGSGFILVFGKRKKNEN